VYFQFLLNGIDIDPERLHSIRLSGIAEIALRAEYGAAMRRTYADMPLSERGGAEYLRLRRQRRADLEAVVRTGITADNRDKALDLVCAICEEPYWAERIPDLFDDDAHPHIDLMAAETALLIAWAYHEGGFSTNVRARMLRELRRRAFTPLIAHDDYSCDMATFCDILTASVMVERDHTRLMTLMRRMTPVIDKMVETPNSRPLKDALKDWTHAAAAWRALRTMAGPQPITRQLPLPAWLDTVLFSHLGDGVFMDKSGGGTVTGLNGADIYYLGKSAGDDAVQALGAYLWQQNQTEISALTAKITCDHTMDMTSSTAGAPRFRHAALNDMSIMSARGGGVAALIHTGGASNAGGMCIYADNSPVFLACDKDSIVINDERLTNINGVGDGEFDDDRIDMSVDITPALPKNSPVRFMQRTMMLDREVGMLRIIDMAECNAPCELEYNFRTPIRPEYMPDGLMVGKAAVTFEGGIRPEIDGEYVIKTRYNLLPGSNMINITIEHT